MHHPTDQDFRKTLYGAALRDFWKGLVSPSPLAFAITVLVLVLATCGMLLVFRQSVVGANPGYWAGSSDDDDVFATASAISASQAGVGVEPLFAIVGPSSLKEAIASEELLESDLSRLAGKPVACRNLATGGQTIVESMALADRALRGPGDVVVLGVSAVRLAPSREQYVQLSQQPRVGFVSPAADGLYKELDIKVPSRSGIYLLDNRHFLFARAPALAWRAIMGPLRPISHRYLDKPLPTPSELDRMNRGTLQRLASYDENHELNLSLLEKFAADFRRTRPNQMLILLECPYSPEQTPEIQEFLDRYGRRIHDFVESHDLVYLNLNSRAEFRGEEFVDRAHLRTLAAMERYTRLLARALYDVALAKGIAR